MLPWVYFLKDDEQLIVETFTSRRSVEGPGVFFCKPFERVTRRKGIVLGPTAYLRVRNKLTGELKIVDGPGLYFVGANEDVAGTYTAIPLQQNQYVRLVDTKTGMIRVERGEQSVRLGPTEDVLEQARDGINIDGDTAVAVRDAETGQVELITTPQVFIPEAHHQIDEVRHRIRLADHEVVVIRDRGGRHILRSGRDENRSFFLEPFTELVQFRWSSGLHKNTRELEFTHLDMRPKFMWYEFEARTQDNVELVLGITFFWQITDAAAMVRHTDDAPGDVCSHARSAIIQAVSQATLEAFLAEFNTITAKAVIDTEDPFYEERGVTLHAVEVRSVSCRDAQTQEVLQQIIRETTNRLNQLQQQESENEIRLKRIAGEIESEEQRRKLLDIRRSNLEAEAEAEGNAEATRVNAFLKGLSESAGQEEAVAMFNTLRKGDVLAKLSEGNAQLYFTPSDVDLTIETRRPA